jgi:hypothetical protein
MEQILARMDASMNASQAKADKTLKETLAEMQEEMKANQAKADANRKTDKEEMNANNKTMLAKIEANGEAIQERMVARMNTTLEEMNASQKEMLAKLEAERKSDVEDLKNMMERMMNTDQTDVKLKEPTDTVETTHRECEEPTSADMKACQETTVCHEATEADIEKIEPDSGMMQSVAEHEEVPREDATVMPGSGCSGWKIVAARGGAEPQEDAASAALRRKGTVVHR